MISRIKNFLSSPLYTFTIFHLIIILLLNIFLSKQILSISIKTPSINDYFLFNIYSLGSFFLFYLFLLIIILVIQKLLSYFIKNSIIPYSIAILLFAFLDILIYADYRTYDFIGIHLHNELVLNVIRNGLIGGEAKLGVTTLVILILVISFFILLETLWLFYFSKRKYNLISYISYFFSFILILSLFISFFIDKDKVDGNILYTFHEKNNKEDNLSLLYPTKNIPTLDPEKKTKILFIIGESLRKDFFNYKELPNINEYLTHNNCIISQNHYSGGHTTVYSIFSIFYSIPAYYHQLFIKRKYKSYPLEVLKNSNYKLFFETSSVLRNFNGANYIIDQFGKNFYQYQKKDNENYEDIAPKLIEKLKNIYTTDKSAYFLFFYNTHYSYYYPKKFQKYSPIFDNPEVVSEGADLSKKYYKIRLENQYKNSILYLDYIFKEVIEVFKEDIKNNNLILVFTGDHGESFKEHGSFGHARSDFHNERINVPFFICMPNIKPRKINLSSHVDIMPTIIDYLSDGNIESKKYSTGFSFLNMPKDRSLLTISTSFPKIDNKFALITPIGKLFIKQLSNDISNFKDLKIFDKMKLNDKEISQKDFLNLKNKYIDDITTKFLKFVKQ